MGKSETATKRSIPANSSVEEAKVTIFLPLTRDWRINAMAKNISALNFDGIEPNLLIVIDNEEINQNQVADAFEKYEWPYPIKILETRNKPKAEFNIAARRDRICEVFNFAKTQIADDSHFVFGIEDDTEFESTALSILLLDYINLTKAGAKVGLVEGVQVGRWGRKMIGAWKVDNLENTRFIETLPYKNSEILQRIDAGGFYCFLTPAKLFKQHNYTWSEECFGPDVTYGLALRKLGYKNFIDWTCITGHITQHKSIYPGDDCVVVQYRKLRSKWVNSDIKKGSFS